MAPRVRPAVNEPERFVHRLGWSGTRSTAAIPRRRRSRSGAASPTRSPGSMPRCRPSGSWSRSSRWDSDLGRSGGPLPPDPDPAGPGRPLHGGSDVPTTGSSSATTRPSGAASECPAACRPGAGRSSARWCATSTPSTSTSSPASSSASAPRPRSVAASRAGSTPISTACCSAWAATASAPSSPCPTRPAGTSCFDLIQVNEDEMRELSVDPMGLATGMLAQGVSALLVTLGERGAVFVAAPGFGRLADGRDGRRGPAGSGLAVRTARLSAPAVEAIDPTGCGDVFGATAVRPAPGRRPLEAAVAEAARQAGRNAGFRGASGLARLSQRNPGATP